MSLNARTHRYTLADVPPFIQPPPHHSLGEDQNISMYLPPALQELDNTDLADRSQQDGSLCLKLKARRYPQG